MNSIAGSDGSAHRVAEPGAAPFVQRVVSALVLGPLALFAAWMGGWVLAVVVGLAAAQMLAEWHRLTGEGSAAGWRFLAKLLLLACAVAACAVSDWWLALGLIAAALPIAAFTVYRRLAEGDRPAGTPAPLPTLVAAIWAMLGMLYIGVPALALLWLRAVPDIGLLSVLWLFAVVWATDTGAYVAGRSIGGPKLAPRLSPNKTWAGLLGGLAAAGLVGAVAAAVATTVATPMGPLVAFSVLVGLLAEIGDLVESAVKRYFGVKDAGTLIPGHGGVLDRLDSLLFAAPTAAILLLFLGSIDAWP